MKQAIGPVALYEDRLESACDSTRQPPEVKFDTRWAVPCVVDRRTSRLMLPIAASLADFCAVRDRSLTAQRNLRDRLHSMQDSGTAKPKLPSGRLLPARLSAAQSRCERLRPVPSQLRPLSSQRVGREKATPIVRRGKREGRRDGVLAGVLRNNSARPRRPTLGTRRESPRGPYPCIARHGDETRTRRGRNDGACLIELLVHPITVPANRNRSASAARASGLRSRAARRPSSWTLLISSGAKNIW